MTEAPTMREEILRSAAKMVTGERQDDYGTPENNFGRIANLWNSYLGQLDRSCRVCSLRGRAAIPYGRTDERL